MNERIKELWSQAGGHYNSGNQHTWPEYTITDPEKFAELIVRECFQIVDDFGVEQAREPENYLGESLNVSMKITDAAWKIKQHFGVKE